MKGCSNLKQPFMHHVLSSVKCSEMGSDLNELMSDAKGTIKFELELN